MYKVVFYIDTDCKQEALKYYCDTRAEADYLASLKPNNTQVFYDDRLSIVAED